MAKKKAGPPKGNTNAQKWSEATATALMKQALALSYDEKYDFIGMINKELMISKNILPYLCENYPNLSEMYSLIKENCETNCYQNAKSAKNQAIYIMNLKSNHKWTDRIQTDNTTTTTIVWEENKTYKQDDK